MITCEPDKCHFCMVWPDGSKFCQDTVSFVRSDTGEECCRYHSHAVSREGYIGRQSLIPTLLNAVQSAYRKHTLHDDRIGWDELSDLLKDAICETIGDDEYMKWVEEVTI